jgi:hypothetical protein
MPEITTDAKALVIVIDASDPAAQERARAAYPPSKSTSQHAIEPGQVKPIRALLFGAAGPRTRPLPHADSSPRAGKGGGCAVCAGGRRTEIEELLAQGLAPYAIAKVIVPGPGDDSIRRHARICLKASAAAEPAQ